jgi:hypothetical protein
VTISSGGGNQDPTSRDIHWALKESIMKNFKGVDDKIASLTPTLKKDFKYNDGTSIYKSKPF